mmetsp:Transcript_6850/g.11058  ORF Transcript_6850/g.11058 Transcript_6850/m.11058 type:complete len:105 (-) Transcript_6850:226-540(-)
MYLTNPPTYECLDPLSEQWTTCSLEAICGDAKPEYRVNPDDSSNIHGLFTSMHMECWSNEEIARLDQFFFVGLSFCFTSIPILESLGRSTTMKVQLIPMTILAY